MSISKLGDYTMTASKPPSIRGTIELVERTFDLSMTLIIGIEAKDGLIVGSDGLTKVTLGYQNIPSHHELDHPKVFQVSPTIVIGITGGMINRVEQVVSDVSASIRKNQPTSLASLAKGLESYIPKIYADRLNHPDFGVSFFIAGYVEDKQGVDEKKRMIFQHEGNLYHYAEDEPWICVGNNRKAYKYMERHATKNMSKKDAIKVVKEAIADTAEAEDDVGGHTFIFEMTQNGIKRLE